jgi:hypothetical protein
METAIIELFGKVPGGMSPVTTTVRTDYAQTISKIVRFVADERRAPGDIALKVQSAMIHHLLHRMWRRGTHFLSTAETIRHLERLAERLVDRQLRSQGKDRQKYGVEFLDDEECRRILTNSNHPRGPIPIGTLIKVYQQLTFEERQVLQLIDQKYSVEDTALILDISVNATEFYLNQANHKIHRAYMALC